MFESNCTVQVAFSEKGTKFTPQTHIRKFEILSAIFPLDWRGTLPWTEQILNHCDFTNIVREIFVCVFGEWILFLSQKKPTVQIFHRFSPKTENFHIPLHYSHDSIISTVCIISPVWKFSKWLYYKYRTKVTFRSWKIISTVSIISIVWNFFQMTLS